MRKEYRDIREIVLYEQEKALFPATQQLVERKLQINKLFKQVDGLDEEYEKIKKERTVPLREFRYSEQTMKVSEALDYYFQLQSNLDSVDEQLYDSRAAMIKEIEDLRSSTMTKKKTYVIACTNAECKGMLSIENVNDKGQYVCSICDALTCNDCKMEIDSSEHKCDQDVLKTIEFMDSTSKPCPSCGIRIHKISGCFAAGTIIPLADGTNVSVNEIEKDQILIGDDGTERIVISTITGTDQLYMIQQSNACSYEVNTYHMLCLMREDKNIILMTLNVYLDLPKTEQAKLFGYKFVNGVPVLSKIEVTPTRVGRFYGFKLSDNQRFLLQDGTVVHNCSQMFCTECHASFDWNSLRLNNGAIHNPHAAAWMRENRGRAREVGDIQCGRELDLNIAVDVVQHFEMMVNRLEKTNRDRIQNIHTEVEYLFEALRIAVHHTHVTIPSLSRNRHGHHTNQNLRVQLLTKAMTELDFKQEIQRRDKAASKRNDLLHLVMTYRDAITEIVWPFVEIVQAEESRPLQEWIDMVAQVHVLEGWINDSFVRIAATYNSANPYEVMSDRTIR